MAERLRLRARKFDSLGWSNQINRCPSYMQGYKRVQMHKQDRVRRDVVTES